MGITGELVRNVFSKSRSIQRHDSHSKSNGVERRKWSNSVRSYLCGDEFNSVLAAEDSASIRSSTVDDLASCTSTRATNISSNNGERDFISAYQEMDTTSMISSEATVNQPLDENPKIESKPEKQNSTYKLFKQEDAALVIQSAFRSFMARRARDDRAKMEEVMTSPSRESISSSIEVQTGNSQSDIFSIKDERFHVPRALRNRARAQVLKLQEDWDDSTVSNVISKMRLQSKMEAATRRERALAYAFSQQLRICSKRRQNTGNGHETNKGWSWLERWMAAREPEEIKSIENEETKVVRKRMLDASSTMESCGSNEVSSLLELNIYNVLPKPSNTSTKVTSNLSRQNSATTNLCPTQEESKDIKKACHVEDEKDTRKKAKHKQPAGNKRDVKDKNATSTQVLLEQ